MPRGSKPGERRGGRKKGTPNKATQKRREIAAKAADQGITPLEVMLNNMRWFHDEAAELVLQATQAARDAQIENPADLVRILKDISNVRQRAQEAARDAAPYMHPRLTAIQGGDADKPVKIDIDNRELARRVALLLTEATTNA